MPVKDRSRYPANWKQISERIRFERAQNKCEWCQAENYQPHPVTGGKVTLTVAHLNHDTTDNRDENLAALCNSCHNGYDAAFRRPHAAETRRRKRIAAGQGELWAKGG